MLGSAKRITYRFGILFRRMHMKKRWNIMAAALAIMASGTAFASNPGELTVRDNGKLFSAEGIKAAKEADRKSTRLNSSHG